MELSERSLFRRLCAQIFLMLQTPKAQNIENTRQIKCTISMDSF